jgi:hypothetical protein
MKNSMSTEKSTGSFGKGNMTQRGLGNMHPNGGISPKTPSGTTKPSAPLPIKPSK